MAESFSETEVSMAEASSDLQPGSSTSVNIATVDVPSLLSQLRRPTSSELARKRNTIETASENKLAKRNV